MNFGGIYRFSFFFFFFFLVLIIGQVKIDIFVKFYQNFTLVGSEMTIKISIVKIIRLCHYFITLTLY